MSADQPPRPPDQLTSTLTDLLGDLDEESLRAAIDYEQALLNARHGSIERIEARPGEEILSTEDHGPYTSVVKQHECNAGCEDCPHGPYLYHVRREKQPDGEQALDWTYLGHTYDT